MGRMRRVVAGVETALFLCEHDLDGIEHASLELLHQRSHQLGRMGGGRLVADVDPLRCHRALGELEVADTLLPDQVQVDRSIGLELLDAGSSLADKVRVERPAQPAIGGDEQQRDPPPRHTCDRLAQQREPLGEIGGIQVGHHLGQGGGVRPGRDDAVLRALQLRRGDELHRLRDLARALDGLDSPAQLPGLRHQRAAIFLYSSMAARSRAASSSGSSLRERISCPTSGCCAIMKSRNPCSQDLIRSGATSSK